MISGVLIGLLIGVVLGVFVFGGHRKVFSYGESVAFAALGRKEIQAKLTRRKNRILQYAYQYGKVTNDDVEEMFCISNNTATNYLRSLVDDGEREMRGAGRGTHYVPKL